MEQVQPHQLQDRRLIMPEAVAVAVIQLEQVERHLLAVEQVVTAVDLLVQLEQLTPAAAAVAVAAIEFLSVQMDQAEPVEKVLS